MAVIKISASFPHGMDDPDCMQYSSCGLTCSDLYNLNIVSLSLVTTVLLIIPKVELSAFHASAHCPECFALYTHRPTQSLPCLFLSHLLSISYVQFHMRTLAFPFPS